MTRLKSRGIISPVRDPTTGYNKYDMNEIGFEVLKELEAKQKASKDSKFSNLIH